MQLFSLYLEKITAAEKVGEQRVRKEVVTLSPIPDLSNDLRW
jgi:hypothetical protein